MRRAFHASFISLKLMEGGPMKKLALLFFGVSIAILTSFSPALSQLEEEVSVDVMEVWVKVTDKNNRIVTDLGPEDFQIFIDGKQMDVRCFDTTFDSTVTTAAASFEDRIPSDEKMKRKYVFYFDLLNSTAREISYLSASVQDFLRADFNEDKDAGMIFALLPNMHLGVVQKMTSNKEALISVVGKMRGNPTLEARMRNNEKDLLDLLYQFGSAGISSAGEGSGVSSRSPETIMQARMLATTLANHEEELSKLTMNTFLSIADHLSGNQFEGRVVMIYVSGGFSMRPGQVYYDMVEKAVSDMSTTGYEDLAFRHTPDFDFYTEVTNKIGLLNRLNVTIYSVDAKGLIGYDRGADRTAMQASLGTDTLSYDRELQDSLIKIAYETGGTAITGTQNFQPGLAAIAADMNQQYWLCSNVPPSTKKGAYHKIQVKVNKPDLKVRYRQGYVD